MTAVLLLLSETKRAENIFVLFVFKEDLQLAGLERNESVATLYQRLFDKQLRPLVCRVCPLCICLCQPCSLEPAVVWWYNSPLCLLPGNCSLEQQVSLESSHEIWMSHFQPGKGICWAGGGCKTKWFSGAEDYYVIAAAIRWCWCANRLVLWQPWCINVDEALYREMSRAFRTIIFS